MASALLRFNQLLQMVDENLLQRLSIALIIFLVFFLGNKIITRYLSRLILLVTTKSETTARVVTAFQKPLHTFFIILGLYIALTYLSVSPAQELFILKLFRSAGIILVAWGFYDLASTESLLSDEFKEKLNIDKILLPFFSKLTRFVILALALCVLAQEWNYDINGFVAGLGLGGLAFALAAKDTLSNIFGGIVIIMDKPFTIGDWISTPSAEGAVENISFRSTRVRTATQAILIVPNSTLANDPITNWSRMGKRRVNFLLPLSSDTTREKLQNCLDSIKKMLEQHPGVLAEDLRVAFEKIADNSLEIRVDFYTSSELNESLRVKEEVNYKIIEILEEQEVSTAAKARLHYSGNLAIAPTSGY